MLRAESLPAGFDEAPGQPPARAGRGATGLQTIEPLYVSQLPESPNLSSAIVSSDGASVYALVHVPVVDTGKLLNQYTLAWTGGIAIIAASVLAVWAWRAAHRRRRVGGLFCRRCDYDVTSLVGVGGSPRCPECGTDLTAAAPVNGRTPFRRLALPVMLLALVLGSYAWLAFFGTKSHPSILPEGRWGSQSLQAWSGNKSLAWMSRASTTGDVLLELDATTGNARRVITTRATRTYWQMEINPAAGAVYLEAPNYDGVDLVDLKSGRVLARFTLHATRTGGTRAPVILGHSPDFGRVYLSVGDRDDRRTHLSEWNWQTGAARDLASVDGFNRADSPSPYPRHYAMIPGESRRFVQFPDFMEMFPAKSFNVKMLDDAGRAIVEKDLGGGIASGAVPAFSIDGRLMFLVRGFGEAIDAYDTASLEHAGSANSADRGSAAREVSIRSDGRLMISQGIQNIDVRDLVEKRWVARLNHPPDSYGPRSLSFSDDGRTVCAVLQSGGNAGTNRGPIVFKLGVWRLPESFAAGAQTLPGK